MILCFDEVKLNR